MNLKCKCGSENFLGDPIEHSPAPWKIVYTTFHPHLHIVDGIHETVASMDGHNGLQDEINAALIINAPMMLADLKDVVLALKCGGLHKPKQWAEALQQRIDQSEGRK